jgi:hypothetical protein
MSPDSCSVDFEAVIGVSAEDCRSTSKWITVIAWTTKKARLGLSQAAVAREYAMATGEK